VKLSEKDVRRVAELANLALRDDEVARLTIDLDGILRHIDKLNELDTAGVEPMTQPPSDLGEHDRGEAATLREDRERRSLSNADAVANAPVTGGGYYKVPRVIER
jgi:aspartyl-tRNA(Asn)/glutamyl-tRNA(Gln) amidotransferase subunit C